MRSMAMALMWEYWRRGWPNFLLALAYMIGFPALIGGAIVLRIGPVPLGDEFNTLPLHHIFLGLGLFGFSTAVFVAQNGKQLEFPSRLYVLPAPAWLIVGCRSVQGIATICVLFLVTAEAYELMFGFGWPKMGPVLFLSAAFVCLQALTWSLRDFRFWKLALYVPIAVTLENWLSRHYPLNGPYESARFWDRVTPDELLALAGCAVVAYVVAVNGMARSRRGDAVGATILRRWLDAIADFVRAPRGPSRPFRSSQHAQFWLEWKRHGIVLPAFVGVIGTVVFIVLVMLLVTGMIRDRDLDTPQEVLEGLAASAVFAVTFLPLVFGLLFGQNMKHNAIMPITDVALARTLLKTGAASIAATWLVCGVILLAGVGWVAATAGFDAIAETIGRPVAIERLDGRFLLAMCVLLGKVFLLVFLLAAVSWTFQGLTASLSVARQGGVWGAALIALLIVSAICLEVLNEKLIGSDAARIVRHGALIGYGTLCLSGTIWAFAAARRRKLISLGTTLMLGVWLVLAGPLWATLLPAIPNFGETVPGSVLLLLVGLSALPLAPLATIPLAVTRARHQ